jgi:hypothetical protein
MGCAPSHDVPRRAPSFTLQQVEEGALLLDLVLLLPPALRRPLDAFAAATPRLLASLAFADSLEGARAGLTAVALAAEARAVRAGGGGSAGAQWSARVIDGVLGRFALHGGGARAQVLHPDSARQELMHLRNVHWQVKHVSALGQVVWVRVCDAGAAAAGQHMTSARAVVVRAMALTAVPRFLASPQCLQLEEALRAAGAAGGGGLGGGGAEGGEAGAASGDGSGGSSGSSSSGMHLHSSVWPWRCTLVRLAQRLGALRSGGSSSRINSRPSDAGEAQQQQQQQQQQRLGRAAQRRAQRAQRAEWLAKVIPLLQDLPYMVTVCKGNTGA